MSRAFYVRCLASFMALLLCNSVMAVSLSYDLQLNSLPTNVNLTAEGTEDWAVWGLDAFPATGSLTPSVRKSGGNAISNLTEFLVSDVTSFSQFTPGPSFTWSDGGAAASGSGIDAMLVSRGNGVNSGLTFSARASEQTRTLKIYTQAYQADAKLVAFFPNAPANQAIFAPYSAGDSDTPGVYTLTYTGDANNDRLNVTFLVDSVQNNHPTHSVGIGAVALSVGGTTGGGSGGGGGGEPGDPNAVPEPASILVWGLLILGSVYVSRRKNSK